MIEKATNLGKIARQSNRPRVPLWDNSMKDMLLKADENVFTTVSRAWLNGWDSENLKIAANETLIPHL